MAVPTVTGLDPASGPEGTHVLITGTGFTEDVSRVRFGSYECQLNYTVISDTAIAAIIPSGSGSQTCYVTNPDGTNSTGLAFTFATYEGGSNSAPTISGVAPNTSATTDGAGGDSVVITGNYFSTAIAVYFGPTLATSVRATFTVDSPTQITATAPRGEPGTQAYVFVENAYGTYSSTSTANDFLYQSSAIPTVTALTPATMLPGFEVVITGTNFTYATAVRVGTLYAAYTIVDSTHIKFIVPGNSTFLGTTVSVYVSNPWGESTTSQSFTYGTLGTLKTDATVSPAGPVAGLGRAPHYNVLISTSDSTVTLTPSYTNYGGGATEYVESTWYRLDDGDPAKYTAPFTVLDSATGYISHKLEYWSVGKDGIVETANIGYVNIVDTKTVTVAATAMLGAVKFSWTAIKIPGERYEVYIDTTSTPTTLVATVTDPTYSYKLSAGATGVYCRVKAVDPDGTTSAYTGTNGSAVQSLQNTTTDLADDAITLAKLAPQLVPPPLASSAPTLPDATTYPTGSYYYNTTNNTLYITNNGTTWSTATAQSVAIIGQVVAGSIRAAAISATELAAKSVFAKQLVVTDYENLVPNPNSEGALAAGLSLPVGPTDSYVDFRGVNNTYANRGTYSRRLVGVTSTTQVMDLTDNIPVRMDDQGGTIEPTEYHFKAWARLGAAATGASCAIRIQGYTAAGATTADVATSSTATSATWQELTADLVIAQTTTMFVRAQAIMTMTTNAATGYFDDMLFRRKLNGFLVVEGTILGEHIKAAQTIEAPIINGGSITGTNVQVLSELLMGTAAAGGIITLNGSGSYSGLLRTSPSGLRVEMSSASASYLKWFSGDATEQQPGKLYLQVVGDNYTRMRLVAPTFNTLDTGAYIDLMSNSATAHDHNIVMTVDGSGTAGMTVPRIELDSLDDEVRIAGRVAMDEHRIHAGSSVYIKHDFLNAAAAYATEGVCGDDFYCSNIGSGLAAAGGATSQAGGTDHPGVMRMYSSNAGNSGRAVVSNGVAVSLQYNDFMEVCFRFTNVNSYVVGRAGCFDAMGTTGPTAGAWIGFNTGNGTTIRAYGYVNNYVTSGYASLSANTWYRGRIQVNSSSVTFTMWTDGGGSVTWSNNSITAMPSADCFVGVTSWNTASTNVYIGDWDYFGCYLSPRGR